MSCYEDLQSLMRARFFLEMAGPRQGGPMVETEFIDFCGQIDQCSYLERPALLLCFLRAIV